MPEGQKLQLSVKSMGQLNLKKGFKYENQDISSYDSVQPTAADLNREVEKNLKVKLPTGKLDEKVETEFITSLDEDGVLAVSNLISQGYSYNAAKALYENKDKYKDITAEGVSKYEKKPSNLPYYGLGVVGGLGTLELGGWGTQQLGGGLGKLGRGIYGATISPSMNESRAKQRLLANQINAEDALKTAKSTGKGVEGAEKLYSEATNKLNDFRGVADTAYDYNVGGGVTKNWGPEARGADARAKANSIFTETIEPALKNSKSKINVQGLVNEIEGELEGLSKLDPDKASEYKDAFEELKKAFSDKKYSELSMSDSQTLKSGLQGRTPQKFFKQSKFASEREITDAYQELRGILSSKIKDEVQGTLSKELGEEAAKLYKDYINLIEYADKEAYAATKGGFKGGAGKFISSVVETLGKPLTQKIGLTIGKIGDTAKKASNVIKPSTWIKTVLTKAGATTAQATKILNAVKKGEDITKMARKGGGKVLTILAPLLDAVAIVDELYQIKERAENSDMPQAIGNKMLRKAGLDKGTDYEGWSEKDWEDAGLGQDVIREYLDSDEFQERLDLTTYKRTGGRERAEKSYRTMYY